MCIRDRPGPSSGSHRARHRCGIRTRGARLLVRALVADLVRTRRVPMERARDPLLRARRVQAHRGATEVRACGRRNLARRPLAGPPGRGARARRTLTQTQLRTGGSKTCILGGRSTAVSRPFSSRSHAHGRGHAIATADLEDVVFGTQRELLDDRREPLAHSPFVVVAERRIVFPSGSSTIAKRSSGVTSYGAQCDS